MSASAPGRLSASFQIKRGTPVSIISSFPQVNIFISLFQRGTGGWLLRSVRTSGPRGDLSSLVKTKNYNYIILVGLFCNKSLSRGCNLTVGLSVTAGFSITITDNPGLVFLIQCQPFLVFISVITYSDLELQLGRGLPASVQLQKLCPVLVCIMLGLLALEIFV